MAEEEEKVKGKEKKSDFFQWKKRKENSCDKKKGFTAINLQKKKIFHAST